MPRMTPKPLRRIDGASRRVRILETATELFSRAGYAGATMKELARACAITEPALYRYFPSKESLYGAVLGSVKTRIDVAAFLRELEQSDDLSEVLSGLARFIISQYTKYNELSRLLLQCSLEGHPQAEQAFTDLRRPFVDFLARKLRRLRRRGVIRNVNPIITARCFVGMVMDCALCQQLWQRVQGKAFKPEVVIANNIPIYVNGLIRRK